MPTPSGKSGNAETLNVTTEDLTAAQMLDRLRTLPSGLPAEAEADGAWTAKEWAEKWGISRRAASAEIQRGMGAGMMERVERLRTHINGRRQSCACYRWIGEQQK